MAGARSLQLDNACHGILDGAAVGKTAQQVERPRRKMYRALPLRHYGAFSSLFGQMYAAQRAGKAAAYYNGIEYHCSVVLFCSSDNPHTLS